MAYEPSWLAGQIATVYLPWLLAAALTRVRVFRFRWLEARAAGGGGSNGIGNLFARRDSALPASRPSW